MGANMKGIGWILFGVLLALLGLADGIDFPVLGWISDDFLKSLSLLCGIIGMSYLYLRDAARVKNRNN